MCFLKREIKWTNKFLHGLFRKDSNNLYRGPQPLEQLRFGTVETPICSERSGSPFRTLTKKRQNWANTFIIIGLLTTSLYKNPA